jgi:hypothetical protein
VVLHTHLQRYGVNPLGFFAPQYIAAGAWAVVFFAYFGVFGFVAQVASRQPVAKGLTQSDGSSAPNRTKSLGVRVLIVVLIAAATAVLPSQILRDPFGRYNLAWAVLGLCFFAPAFYTATLTIRPPDRPVPALGEYWSNAVIRVLVWLLVLPVGLVVFGGYIYPSIPARWGGGEPVPVQVVIATDAAGRLFRAGIIRDSSQARSFGHILLLTDDDVLLLPRGHIRPVLLRRSLVPALVLQPIDTPDLQTDTKNGTP